MLSENEIASYLCSLELAIPLLSFRSLPVFSKSSFSTLPQIVEFLRSSTSFLCAHIIVRYWKVNMPMVDARHAMLLMILLPNI